MKRPTDFLTNIRRIIKLHESMLKGICETYRLSLIEATIISFLYNNPGKDTAADIVELRMLSKGNGGKLDAEILVAAQAGHRGPSENPPVSDAGRPTDHSIAERTLSAVP